MDVSETGNEPRFEFGDNWTEFLKTVDERRIQAAIDSMQSMLGVDSLRGKTFLDVGCGSGLASLAATRMGANVHAFDYDSTCVGCACELKKRFATPTDQWNIEQGSALDSAYLSSLGRFDVVYSWGVLHHTGNMNQAINLCSDRVVDGGLLFIAIYHDQGSASRRWAKIKRTYLRLPVAVRPIFVITIASAYEAKFALGRLAKGQNPLPFDDWSLKAKDRGMSAWHDWVDWIGGWPFEVATPDRIINPLVERGFALKKVKTLGNGWGCNEYVFQLRKGINA